MHVGIGIFGDVVVDDVRDTFDVDATADDIGGDEDADFPLAIRLHDSASLVLGHIPLHRHDAANPFAELVSQSADAGLHLAKDKALARFLANQKPHQKLEFSVFVDTEASLLDPFDVHVLAGEIDHGRVDHVAMGELEDFVGHGGREKKRLALDRNLFQDSFDVWPEADIEHAVGFVQDDDADTRGIEVSASHHVDDSSRGSDDDLRASAKFADLSIKSFPAVNAGHLEAEIADEFFPFLVDLVHEFSGRPEDEDLGKLVVGAETLKDRQKKGGGLAGAGLGLADDVDSLESFRDKSGLDRRRLSVADTVEICEDFRPEVQFFKTGFTKLGFFRVGVQRVQNNFLCAKKLASPRTTEAKRRVLAPGASISWRLKGVGSLVDPAPTLQKSYAPPAKSSS